MAVGQKYWGSNGSNVDQGKRTIGVFYNVKAIPHSTLIHYAVTATPEVGAVARAVRPGVNGVVAGITFEPIVACAGHHGVGICISTRGEYTGAQQQFAIAKADGLYVRQGVQALATVAVRQAVCHCDGVAIGVDHATEAGGRIENHACAAVGQGNGVARQCVFIAHVVGAIAAIQTVISAPCVQEGIVTQAALQAVTAVAAHQRVVARPAIKRVITRATFDAV